VSRRSATEQLDDLEALLLAQVQDIRDQLAAAGFDEAKESMKLSYHMSLSYETTVQSLGGGIQLGGLDNTDDQGQSKTKHGLLKSL
jgi:hypothetical protein